MPFSKQNNARYGGLTGIIEPILDSAADEQTKMLGAVIASKGIEDVLKQIEWEIRLHSQDSGSAAAFKKWKQSYKIENLSSYTTLETNLNALGLSDDAVAGVMRKADEQITQAYGGGRGRS